MSLTIDLNGHHALVTGASQGIGAETAVLLAECGASVHLLARSEDKLKKVLATLQGNGHSYHVCDMQNTELLNLTIEQILSKYEIDILIHNAGGPKPSSLMESEVKDFDVAFQTHVHSAQTLAKKIVPIMKKKNYGRIINIISTSVKAPIPNLLVSNTIRAAMANWSKTLAGELGPFGITVNNVLPGFTKTERLESLRSATAIRMKKSEDEISDMWLSTIPAQRFAEPEELASAIAFLASPLASYINGINLPVDGGRTQSL
jgi:3-oxoacyl-[acyl-carrier protein] reductase